MMNFEIFFLVLFASMLQGATGFGSGLVLMATLPFFISIKTATIVVSFTVMFISLFMVWRNRKSIDFQMTIYPLIGMLTFMPLGVFILDNVNEDVLKYILGFLIIVISIFFFVAGNTEIKINPSPVKGVIVGMIGGILGGMFTIGGPPLVIYFIQVAKDKLNYKSSLDFIFTATSIYRLVWLYALGNIEPQIYPNVFVSLIVGIIGTSLGFSLFTKINRELLSKTIYVVMIFAGISLVLK